MSENGVSKSQKCGLLSVGACRFGLGIEIVERILDTLRHTKLAFQSVKQTLFSVIKFITFVTDVRNFDLFELAVSTLSLLPLCSQL